MTRTLEEVLQSVSEDMFPDEEGNHAITIDTIGEDGDLPLHALAWKGDVDGIVTLLDAGADVDARGEDGETALHIAIHEENAVMIAVLLAAGASLDIKSDFDETPVELAKWMKVKLPV